MTYVHVITYRRRVGRLLVIVPMKHFSNFFYLGKKQFIVEAKPASNDANRKAKLSPSCFQFQDRASVQKKNSK